MPILWTSPDDSGPSLRSVLVFLAITTIATLSGLGAGAIAQSLQDKPIPIELYIGGLPEHCNSQNSLRVYVTTRDAPGLPGAIPFPLWMCVR